MTESVIINTPLLLIGTIIAIALCVFDIIKHSGYIVPILSSVLSAVVITTSLIIGASMQEVLILTLILLALNMTAFSKGGN